MSEIFKTKRPKTFLAEFGELAKFLRNLEYLVPLIFPLTCHYEKRRDRQAIVRIINQRAMMGYCAREQLRFWSKHATDVVGSPADVQPNNHRIYGHAEGLTRYILRGCEALALVRKSPSASAGRGTHGNITFVCSLYRKPGISIWVRQQQQLSSLSGPAIDFVLEGPSCVHLNYV